MNILITSVGRRAYIVKYFKESLSKNDKVFVSNSDKNSVAFKYADDCFITPLIYDDGYIDFLLNICKKKKVDVLISLFDIDLLILAKNRKRFEELGTKLIVSDEKLIENCNDKWKTYLFLNSNNFNVPKTYVSLENAVIDINNGIINYPVIVKPRFGCGSIGILKADNYDELMFFYKYAKKEINNTYLKYESSSVSDNVIIQECLYGMEYGADIINDLNGNFCNCVIRKKIAMRSGETDIAEIVENDVIKSELIRLGTITKHVANMDCDIFLCNNKPYILEMNARFGGGYPFSHLAGCNLPLAIIKWVNNDMVDTSILKSKINLVGYKELLVVTKNIEE